MNDELILTLADIADISPKKVRLIINAYEKAKTGYKPVPPVPEDYITFKYEGKRYAYKSLGSGPWTPECASVELMKILKNHFIRSGKMEEGGCWPGSSYYWAWTGDVDSYDDHVDLYSDGGTGSGDDVHYHARFAVLPLSDLSACRKSC